MERNSVYSQKSSEERFKTKFARIKKLKNELNNKSPLVEMNSSQSNKMPSSIHNDGYLNLKKKSNEGMPLQGGLSMQSLVEEMKT